MIWSSLIVSTQYSVLVPWSGEFNTYIKERYTFLHLQLTSVHVTVNVSLNEEMHVYFMATLLLPLPGSIRVVSFWLQEDRCEIMTLKCSFSARFDDVNLPTTIQFPVNPKLLHCHFSARSGGSFVQKSRFAYIWQGMPEIPLMCHLQLQQTIHNKTTNRLAIRWWPRGD